MAQDEASEYAKTGRRFRYLSDVELHTAWITAFRAYAASLDDVSAQKTNDLASEHLLRGLETPLLEVLTEALALVERGRKRLTEIALMSIIERMEATKPRHKHWLEQSDDTRKH